MENYRQDINHIVYRVNNNPRDKFTQPERDSGRASGRCQREIEEDDESYSKRSNRPSKKHGNKTGLAILFDILIAALIMLVFYITNYIVQPKLIGKMLPTPSAPTSIKTPVPKENGFEDGASASPIPDEPAVSAGTVTLRDRFSDKFTNGDIERTDTSYRSANINVSINKVQKDGVTYFLADIYIADIQYFRTAFAKQPDVMGDREFTNIVAGENNAILAINGDHCVDNNGPVIRNGQLYRDQVYADSLVMNYDGSMQTYSADQLNMDAVKANGAWQIWTFGPMLLKDGQPMTKFNSTLGKTNPRTAVGYYEPGHYCFLVVDGREPGYSDGMTFSDMSQLFYELGCKTAFNLDGGQSSEMVFMGNVVNRPYNGGRSTTDILFIGDNY